MTLAIFQLPSHCKQMLFEDKIQDIKTKLISPGEITSILRMKMNY